MLRLYYKLKYKVKFAMEFDGIRVRYCMTLTKPKVFKHLIYLPIRYYSESLSVCKINAAKYLREAKFNK